MSLEKIPFTVGSTKDITLAKTGRTSAYADVISAIRELKPGKTLNIPTPKGKTAKQIIAGISSVLMFRKVKAPAGMAFSKRQTVTGDVVVFLSPRKARRTSKK